jgi:hypothetical protein
MRKITLLYSLLLFTLALGSRAIAQDTNQAPETAKTSASPAHFYRLDFVIQELDAKGKPVNGRTYSTVVTTPDEKHEPVSIRTSSRIPIPIGTVTTDENGKSVQNHQFQYQDIGIDIDVNYVREIAGKLTFHITAKIEDAASASMDAGIKQPITHSYRWVAVALIPVGKPTAIFTSDILDSKGAMQMVVTATPIQ